jgi:AbiTii
MQAEGLSLQTMANRLNAEGVPTLSGKGRWQKDTIGNLLAQGDKKTMTSKDSLAVELQQKAMDSDVRISDVVRMALAVATKLDLEAFRNWCLKELKGYEGQEVPPYRLVQGELKAIHPGRPPILVRFPDAEITQALAYQSVRQRVGELEDLYKSSEESKSLEMPLSPSVITHFFANTEKYREGFTPVVVISRSQLYGILDSVRNALLEWSLGLERDGIHGEGLTFSSEEKRKAERITYNNIQQFTGVLGDIHSSSVQIGDYNAIHGELKRRGVPVQERNELEDILDKLPSADPEERESLLARGGEWLSRNAGTIGTLSGKILEWLQYFRG